MPHDRCVHRYKLQGFRIRKLKDIHPRRLVSTVRLSIKRVFRGVIIFYVKGATGLKKHKTGAYILLPFRQGPLLYPNTKKWLGMSAVGYSLPFPLCWELGRFGLLAARKQGSIYVLYSSLHYIKIKCLKIDFKPMSLLWHL